MKQTPVEINHSQSSWYAATKMANLNWFGSVALGDAKGRTLLFAA
jgi:surface antigen